MVPEAIFTNNLRILKVKLFHIIIFVLPLITLAQTNYEQRTLDRDRWNEYRDNFKYTTPESDQTSESASDWSENGNGNQNTNYEDRKTENEGLRPSEKSAPEEQSSTSFSFSGIGLLGYIFIGIAAAAIIIGIVYLVMNREKNPKAVQPEPFNVDDDIDPTEIEVSELQKQINACIQKKNYRKAIRLYYIFTLKALSEHHWIDWQKEKTNISYLMEMRDRKEYQNFEDATKIYEYTWYGKIPVNDQQFNSIAPIYTSLIKTLEPNAI